MIHVVTAHFKSADWIELQRQYLDRFVGEPFQLWGSLEKVGPEHRRHFDHVVPSLGMHAGKLNLIARIICDTADPDDLLVFLDGDAFPVAEFVDTVRASLASTPLTAVQRLENRGDTQPHPCFCVTTVGFWADLPGDWSSGHVIRKGRTDVGANLLHRLETTGNSWTPILRSHSVDDHDVLFGIYGGFLYHHGAGFRPDKTTAGDRPASDLKPRQRLKMMRRNEQHAPKDEQFEAFVARNQENEAMSERIYDAIRADPAFFDRILRPSPV